MGTLNRPETLRPELETGEKSSLSFYDKKVDDMIAYYESILLANANQLINIDGCSPYSSSSNSSVSSPPSRLALSNSTPSSSHSSSRFPCYRWERSYNDSNLWPLESPTRRRKPLVKSPSHDITFPSPKSTLNSPLNNNYTYYEKASPQSSEDTWSDLSELLFDPEDEDSSAYQVQRIRRAYRQEPLYNDSFNYDYCNTTSSTVSDALLVNVSNYEDPEECWNMGFPSNAEFLDVQNPPIESATTTVDITMKQIKYRKINNNVITLKMKDLTNGKLKINGVNEYQVPQIWKTISYMSAELLSHLIQEDTSESCPNPEKVNGIRQRLANSLRSFKFRREQKRGLFNHSLKSIRNKTDLNSPLPLFIHNIMNIVLNEASEPSNVGLFRTAALKSKVDEARKLCETLGPNNTLPDAFCDAGNVPVLADIFKQFIREIPDQLVPKKVWSLLIKCANKLDNKDSLKVHMDAYRCCLCLLEVDNRDALLTILAFLNKVSEFSNTTLMSINNLISVFLPTICKFVSEPGDSSESFLNDCKSLTKALNFLIKNIEQVMEVPDQIKAGLNSLDNDIIDNDNNYGVIRLNKVIKFTTLPSPIPEISCSKSNSEPMEYRADIVLMINTIDLFRFMIETRSWDPTFTSYTYLKTINDDVELFQAQTKFYPQNSPPICVARVTTRHYVKAIQKHTFILIERSVPSSVYSSDSSLEINKIHFILRRLDSYHTKVTVVISLNNLPSHIDLSAHTCDILHSLKQKYFSRTSLY